LEEGLGWLPDLGKLEKEDLSKVKLMWINFPNMPTGAAAPDEFYNNIIAFAKRHQILIVNDNPYSFILHQQPKSFMSFEGAKEVAIELNSLSKSHNMAGWRVGMLVGKQAFELMDLLNCKYDKSQTGLFVWAKIPDTCVDCYKMSDEVLYDANIFITPGGIFGSQGEKFVRISLCNTVDVLENCLSILQQHFSSKAKVTEETK